MAYNDDYARFLDHSYNTSRINIYIDELQDDLTFFVGEDGLNVSEDEDSIFSDNISLDLEIEDKVVSFNNTKGGSFFEKIMG